MQLTVIHIIGIIIHNYELSVVALGVTSFLLKDFDFCVFFLCSCLYSSKQDDANENPRIVTYNSQIFWKITIPRLSSIVDANKLH